MNAILNKADESFSEMFINSYDSKQVVHPYDKHKMWRWCEYQDHTYDQSRTNAITAMSNLFFKTEQTRCEIKLNHNISTNKCDVLLRS